MLSRQSMVEEAAESNAGFWRTLRNDDCVPYAKTYDAWLAMIWLAASRMSIAMAVGGANAVL